MKIGILGGGQLGRMSILAGRALGHRFSVFDPSPSACAGHVADELYTAGYEDTKQLEAFAKGVDVATLEFENVPTYACDVVTRYCPLRPSASVLSVAQHRLREKSWLAQKGFPCAKFAVANDQDELTAAIEEIGRPCVVKTAAFGYDGKGQVVVRSHETDVLERLGNPPSVVVEQWIAHQGEFSVICARRPSGETRTFPIFENVHRNHILHATIFPGRVRSELAARAHELAVDLATELEVEGVLAVELFLDENDEWLVNEIAPRPHNSGHVTIDACATSQFEQHVRTVLDQPLGDTRVRSPAVMVNLLGDVWNGGEPDFASLLADPSVKLHVYDKGEPRPGRKMGHYTVLADHVDDALGRADAWFERLAGR